MDRIVKRLMRLGVMLAGVVVFLLITGVVQTPLRRSGVPPVVGAAIMIPVLLACYYAIQRLIERRIPVELRTSVLANGIIGGLAIGVLLFAITIGVLFLAHNYAAAYSGTFTPLVGAFVVTVAAALAEEILFRAFLYRAIRDQLGIPAGIAVSAIIFGLLHAFNHGATVVSTVAIAIEAGILLSVAYQVTNALWLPVGIHIGWNFAEANIFGTSVSGMKVEPSILAGTLKGPVILTGGMFGPEASIVAVLVCLCGAAVLWRAGNARGMTPKEPESG